MKLSAVRRRSIRFGMVLLGLYVASFTGFEPGAWAAGSVPALPVSQQIVAQTLGVPPAQLPIGRVIQRNNILAAIQIVVRLSGQSADQVYSDFVSSVVGYCRGQPYYPVHCDSITSQADQNAAQFVIR
jgi:hypothetical protein